MVSINDVIPNINSIDQDNNTVNLFEIATKQKKKIVVYFYPKDDTPGCTKEACSFRDDYAYFEKNNIAVFGVSKDSINSHVKFITKYKLPFPLISDTNLELTKKLGAFGKKRTGGEGLIRSTFIIDENGKIRFIFGLEGFPKVNTAIHSQEVIEALKNL